MSKNIRLILFVALLAGGCGQDDTENSAVRRAKRPMTDQVTQEVKPIPTNCVDLVLAVACQPCNLGQPILVDVTITNTTTVTQQAGGIPPKAVDDPSMTLSLEDEAGKPVPIMLKVGGVFTGKVAAVELAPGGSHTYPQPTDLSDAFAVHQKGVYTLRASRQFPLHGVTNLCTAVAAPVKITVRNTIQIFKGVRKEVSPTE